VAANRADGATWVHSYVWTDKRNTYCMHIGHCMDDGPSAEAVRTVVSGTVWRSTRSERSAWSIPASTVERDAGSMSPERALSGVLRPQAAIRLPDREILERDLLLEALDDALAGAGRGHGRLVLVRRAAGIGQTTLVREFTSRPADAVGHLRSPIASREAHPLTGRARDGRLSVVRCVSRNWRIKLLEWSI